MIDSRTRTDKIVSTEQMVDYKGNEKLSGLLQSNLQTAERYHSSVREECERFFADLPRLPLLVSRRASNADLLIRDQAPFGKVQQVRFIQVDLKQ